MIFRGLREKSAVMRRRPAHGVEELVAQAFDKGLEDAIRAAKRCDPFIEDAFHDALTEQLIPELKRRGILK